MEFFRFWGRCFWDAWTMAGGILGIIQLLAIIVWGISRRKGKKLAIAREEQVGEFAKWCFLVLLIPSAFIYAPYKQYVEAVRLLSEQKAIAQAKDPTAVALKTRALNIVNEISDFPTQVNEHDNYYQLFTQRFEIRLSKIRDDLADHGVYSLQFDRKSRFPSDDNNPGAFSVTNLLSIADELKKLAEQL